MAAEPSIKRIVVGVDGSAPAAEALDWAIKFARCQDSEIIAVFAIAPPGYLEYGAGYGMPVPPIQLDPAWRAQMQELFENEWCSALRESGVRFRTVCDHGHPATLIADVADRVDADLVVVGRRGRGTVAEALLGSVSHELSHHCKRPVLLISRDGSQAAKQAEPALATQA